MSSTTIELGSTVGGGGSSGVSSLNSETGALTIAAGSGIAVASGGSTITISSTTSDPSTSFNLLDDFTTAFYSGGSGQIFSDYTWTTLQTGSPGFDPNGSVAASSNSHPGVMQITATAAGTDGGAISAGVYGGSLTASFATGNGLLSCEALVFIQLSAAGNNGEIVIGFSDAPGWSGSNNRIVAYYQVETSPNWILGTSAAGSGGTVTSSTAVAAGWHHVKVTCDAAGAVASMYIDGVLATTSSAHIPTAAMPPMISFRKTLGAAAKYLGVDYIKINKEFTVAR